MEPQRKLVSFWGTARLARQSVILHGDDFEIDEDHVRAARYDPEEVVMFARSFVPDMENSSILTLVPLLEKFPLDYIGICSEYSQHFRIKRKVLNFSKVWIRGLFFGLHFMT